MADFTWTPDRNFNVQNNPRVLTAQFGDGYSQRVQDGINTINKTWSVTFNNRPSATIEAIDTFLSSKAGAGAFTWLPPGSASEVTVIAPTWSKTYITDTVGSIQATFERVYD